MTGIEIMQKFNKMLLVYKGTAERRQDFNRLYRGYWMIPGEAYEFRIIAIDPRNTWAIEVKQSYQKSVPWLLSEDMGIHFIQRIICDKFEFIGGVENYSWYKHQEQKTIVISKRLEFLMMYNINKDYAKKNTKIK